MAARRTVEQRVALIDEKIEKRNLRSRRLKNRSTNFSILLL